MSVIFFESWDLHVRTWSTGITPLGVWDHDGYPDWAHGNGGNNPGFEYTDGYQGGQAFSWFRTSGTIRVDNVFSEQEIRAHFFAKPRNKHEDSGLMFILRHVGAAGEGIAIRGVGSDGTSDLECVIATVSGPTDFLGSVVSAGSFTMDDDWANYEFYVNAATGAVEVKKNGTVVLSETVTLLDSADFDEAGIFGGKCSLRYDHLVITDGESLNDTEGFKSVSVSWQMFGQATGPNTGMRARIDVGGTTYFGTTFESGLATDPERSPHASNVWREYWHVNPDTLATWGGTLDGIETWGLCRTDSTGGWLVVPCAALEYVVMDSDGYPQVNQQTPDDTFSVDEEVWERTHGTRDWEAHVDNYPRVLPAWDFALFPYDYDNNPNPFDNSSPVDWSHLEYDELFFEDYLGCTGPGCIQFTSDPPEPPTSYGGTGLAFAEEYRTSYRDWQSIVPSGEEFTSYFISGYKIHGEGNKKFQNNYLTINFKTDALGSAYVQGVWDYALGNEIDDGTSRSDTGRWGSTQQVYGPRNNVAFKHAFSKLKIRGHGKALQLKVKSEDGKPFYINGWAMFVTGNSTT